MRDLLDKYKNLTFIQRTALFLVLGSAALVIAVIIFTSNNNDLNLLPNNPPDIVDDSAIPLDELQDELYIGFKSATETNTRQYGDRSILPSNYEAEYIFDNKTINVKRFNDLYRATTGNIEMYFVNSYYNLFDTIMISNRSGWGIDPFNSIYTVPEGFIYGPMLETLLQRSTTINRNRKTGDMSVYNSVLADYINSNLATDRTGLNYNIYLEYQGNTLSSIRIVFPLQNAGEWAEFRLPEININFNNVGQVPVFNVSREIINQIR